MLKNILILFVFFLMALLPSFSFGQTSRGFGTDILEVGSPTSSADPKIKFTGTNAQVKADKASGKLQFSNDGTIWKNFGSGSGGGAGATQIALNSGFEDGITVNWSATAGTVNTVSGAANALTDLVSIQFDPSAQNDYLRSDYITVPKGLRGSACEARFKYVGADRNVFAKVETESGVVLGTYISSVDGFNGLPAHTFADYESIFFKCPTDADITTLSTNGNIRLVIYQGTVTNAAAGTFDEIHIGGLIGLTESSTPDAFGGYVNNLGVISNTYGGVITGCSVSSNIKTCSFVGLTTIPTCSLEPLEANTNAVITKVTNLSSTSISFVAAGTGGAAVSLDMMIECHKSGADAKQSVQVYKSIPKISSLVNVYPFWINTGAGGTTPTVIFDPYSVVSSISQPGTGLYDIIFNATNTAFSSIPIPVCTTSEQTVEIDNVFTDKVSIATRNAAGSLANVAGTGITCYLHRQDIKMPTVQPIVIGQVTNSKAESSLNNVRVESCQINNNGTATLSTLSGMCEGWIQSVTRASAGLVQISFKPGTFSAPPNCTVANAQSGNARYCQVENPPSNVNMATFCVTAPTTAADLNHHVICQGIR